MTVITEAELREMWQGGRSAIVRLPRGVRFTPAARDFINEWRLEIAYTDEPAATPPQSEPRALFRSKLDTLHAWFLLAGAQARRFNLPDLADYLATLAAYCREIAGAEFNDREVPPLQMAGLAAGLGHVAPAPGDHELLLWLNLLHCQVRETELLADVAFTGPDGDPGRADLIQPLSRLSGAVCHLIQLFKAGKITWRNPSWLERSA